MKLLKTIALLLFYLVLYLGEATGNTKINGRISGDIPERIEYSVPVNGVAYVGFRESVKPKPDGTFQISLQVEKPAFVMLIVPGKSINKIITEPGKEYSVLIKSDKSQCSFEVTGTGSKGQNLYASLPNPEFIEMEAKKIENGSSESQIKEKIASQKAIDIAKFKDLLDRKEISQAFFDLVKSDRDCYYAAILVKITSSKFRQAKPDNDYELSPETKQFWDNIYTETPLNQPKLMQSSFWFEYSLDYVRYKEFTRPDFSIQKMKELSESGIIHTYVIQEARKAFSGVELEYFQAAYIYFQCSQRKYEKEFIALFNDFKKDWPNSGFTKYLKPIIDPIIEYVLAIDKPLNKKIVFVDHSETFKSLQECLAQFKGKKLFIDVWATWCGPCKDEFKYKAKLYKLLKSKGYEILYISIDRDQQDKKWKEMVKFYDLEGFHVRSNVEFNDDLHSLFNNGKGKTIAIPWYIVTGNNGEIIKLHAHRPSELNELEKELAEN